MSTQHQGIFHTRKNSRLDISKTKKNILYVLFYYVKFALIILVYFGFYTADTDLYRSFSNIFPLSSIRTSTHSDITVWSKGISTIYLPRACNNYLFLIGFLTTTNLTFVINWSTVNLREKRNNHFLNRLYHDTY